MVILEEETFKKFGYYSYDLSKGSHKPVVIICDGCGIVKVKERRRAELLCPSCAGVGHVTSEETKQKIRETLTGIPHTDERNRNISKALKGNHYINISKARKGKYCGENSPNWKPKIKRICEICKKEFEVNKSVVESGRARFCSRKCMAVWRSADPEILERLRNIGKTGNPGKSKPEQIFDDICKKNNLPFIYVGDRKKPIGNKKSKVLYPDFIEANGKKLLVEIMGLWWHSPLQNHKLDETRLQPFRTKHYKKYGWKSIFIWDTDILSGDAEEFVIATIRKSSKAR